MSWLLVAFIPGLLMLATFGLDRIEAALRIDTVSESDIDEFVEQAKAESVRKPSPVHEVIPHDTLPLREPQTECPVTEWTSALPTRVYVHHTPKTQFQQTRQADRV